MDNPNEWMIRQCKLLIQDIKEGRHAEKIRRSAEYYNSIATDLAECGTEERLKLLRLLVEGATSSAEAVNLPSGIVESLRRVALKHWEDNVRSKTYFDPEAFLEDLVDSLNWHVTEAERGLSVISTERIAKITTGVMVIVNDINKLVMLDPAFCANLTSVASGVFLVRDTIKGDTGGTLAN